MLFNILSVKANCIIKLLCLKVKTTSQIQMTGEHQKKWIKYLKDVIHLLRMLFPSFNGKFAGQCMTDYQLITGQKETLPFLGMLLIQCFNTWRKAAVKH